jgi:DNA polymerase-3 subunit epsilon
MRIYDRDDAIDVAKDILNNKSNYVIFDTETTGLGENDVIVQIGLLDLYGNVLMDTLIKPTKRKRISGEATAIHGITMKMLQNAPTFKEIYPRFGEIIRNKQVLIYNAEYDSRLYWQTSAQDEIEPDSYKYLCIMLLYSVFVGDWSDYHGNYKYQRLTGSDHTAIGDCKATLELLNKMAMAEKTLPPVKTTIVEKASPSMETSPDEKTLPPKKKWWQFWL